MSCPKSNQRRVSDQYMGRSGEKLFENLTKKFRLFVRKSTRDEDYFQHWDYLVHIGGIDTKVEVKALKKVARHHSGAGQDRFVWLEINGVRGPQGEFNPGWICGSHADYIAFQTKEGFMMLRVSVLKKIIDVIVDRGHRVKYANQALYSIYERGRGDACTLVKKTDLLKLNPIFLTESFGCFQNFFS